MRISDWSSDVCSSDLLAGLRLTKAQSDNFLAVLLGGPVPVGGAAPLTLADTKNGPVIAAGLRSELMVARPDILTAEERLRAARAKLGADIGRASVMERVCQDV